MPSFPSRQLVARLVVSALASAVAGGAAGAQPFTSRFISAGVQAATLPAGPACGTPVSAPGPGTSSASCAFAGGVFSVVGRAEDGRVGAYAYASAAPLGAPTSNIFDAQGQGQWGDRLTFTGLVPATTLMGVHFEGSLEGHATGDAGVNLSASWNFQASGSIGNTLADYHESRSLLAIGNPIFGGESDVFEAVLEERSFLMPVTPTGTTAPPYIDFLLIVFARSTVVGGFDPGAGTGVADFNNTGLVTRLAFFDATGNDITNSVQYEFSRGTLIGPIVTAAPEPATVTLVAGGLLAVGAVARRRRAMA
jgi:hypothetical protein